MCMRGELTDMGVGRGIEAPLDQGHVQQPPVNPIQGLLRALGLDDSQPEPLFPRFDGQRLRRSAIANPRSFRR